MHGTIVLMHGCHYNIDVRKMKKGGISVQVRDSGMVTVLKYKTEKEFDADWVVPEE